MLPTCEILVTLCILLRRYMPPEAMKHGHLTKATDIYSAGILAWELITSTIAFAGMTAAQVFFCVLTEVGCVLRFGA